MLLFVRIRAKPERTGLEVIEGKMNLGVRGEHFEVLFSAMKGGIVSYRFGGNELIDQIPRPNFWRAPVNNDYGNRMAARYGIWKIASAYQEFSDPEKGIFDASPDEDGYYPKISRTPDYIEIIWKKYLPVLCGGSRCGIISGLRNLLYHLSCICRRHGALYSGL